MLIFDILDEGLGIVSPVRFVYNFPTKMLLMLTDQIGHWAICVLQLFVNQVVMSEISKLIGSS